ncbi:MAG: hypothetical protein MZV70_76685 [Desulfobacterales bacterium]|nr:hypothetical protein [Desulfobacterales bacterium]
MPKSKLKATHLEQAAAKLRLTVFLLFMTTEEDEKAKAIPELAKGDVVKLKNIDPKQHLPSRRQDTRKPLLLKLLKN